MSDADHSVSTEERSVDYATNTGVSCQRSRFVATEPGKGATTMRRRSWKPQYSLKLVLLLTTAVCLYLTCWSVTQTLGVKVVGARLSPMRGGDTYVEPNAPFVLSHSAARIRRTPNGIKQLVQKRTYYLWVFGCVEELPFGAERVSNIPSTPRLTPPTYFPTPMPSLRGPIPADRIPPSD
jgi:hypothetical protein